MQTWQGANDHRHILGAVLVDPNRMFSLNKVSLHKAWPDLPVAQGELFFECTLFLYSVLALFLQYLNLYKTLWWLPKSYWPTSLKYYMINPYLLSCIGLMLGVRVTRCFWNTISDLFNFLTQGKESVPFSIVEYAVLKTPIFTMVFTSFIFSFSRVYVEFSFMAMVYFAIPLFVYAFTLWINFDGVRKEDYLADAFTPGSLSDRLLGSPIAYVRAVARANTLLDFEKYTHKCQTASARDIRAEADFLAHDFFNRLKFSIFVGFMTAYLSIYLPVVFVPQKSTFGTAQYMLINYSWVAQIFAIVFLTSFSIYFTYLVPMHYVHLLSTCADHLGLWEPCVGGPAVFDHVMEFDEGAHAQAAEIVVYKQKFYKRRWFTAGNVSLPDSATHAIMFRLFNSPIRVLTIFCYFEFGVVLFQFWLLMLTTDWQHIVTLVLLMFANYLLLSKLFKDRVVMGRIYNPTKDDMDLWYNMFQEQRREDSNEGLVDTASATK